MENDLSCEWIEIPRFALEESIEIENLFSEHSIQYTKKGVTLYAGVTGGHQEYIFQVSRPQIRIAIEILKDFFGVGLASNGFTGICPACGIEAKSVIDCKNCGLRLSGDFTDALHDHPFIIFLKQEKLL